LVLLCEWICFLRASCPLAESVELGGVIPLQVSVISRRWSCGIDQHDWSSEKL